MYGSWSRTENIVVICQIILKIKIKEDGDSALLAYYFYSVEALECQLSHFYLRHLFLRPTRLVGEYWVRYCFWLPRTVISFQKSFCRTVMSAAICGMDGANQSDESHSTLQHNAQGLTPMTYYICSILAHFSTPYFNVSDVQGLIFT